MKIHVITMFPQLFHDIQQVPLVKRALDQGILNLEVVDLKDFADGSYRHIDDSPYGGGAGMILKCEPVDRALQATKTEQSYVVYPSPIGTPLTQEIVRSLSQQEDLVILCGHYEGMDARIEAHVDECISLGDYILSGGEGAACILIDAITRLKGTIRKESTMDESFENGLLEYPQYTRPAEYRGERVPEVLLSGHDEKIRQWRLQQSLIRTKERRPDLFEKHSLSEEEQKLLEENESLCATIIHGKHVGP